jgi:hypothetical protein
MERVTVDDVPSIWYRGLEGVLLLPALMLLVWGLLLAGAVVLGSVESFDVFAGPASMVYLVLLVVGPLLTFATPVLLFLDRRKIVTSQTSRESAA